MTTLNVGVGQTFGTLASAIAASHDGDVIKVQAGTYINDFAIINTKITIQGVGGMVNLVATIAPPNGKAILVTNTDITLDHIAFSGAVVPDGNGAGIRYQGGNLVINNCYFHNNQDGLLSADAPTGSITITNSEFAFNGTTSGLTHNLYVGQVGTLTITNSYFHDANTGHEIKSRAFVNVITNNRIVDGPTATASYSIDLPNGGNNTVSNNIIEQGPKSQNASIIHLGGATMHPGSTLMISNNTILNDLNSGSARLLLNQTAVVPNFTGNKVFGLTAAQLASGPINATGTTFLTVEPAISTSHPYLTSTPAPVPAPQPAPVPVPQPTPVPAPQPAPVPVPQPKPVPVPQPTPVPVPQPAPVPVPQPTPVPVPQPTPVPVPQPTPVPTQNPVPVCGPVVVPLDTLTLQLSAGAQPASFIRNLDGHALGAVNSVTAQHAAAAYQDFSFSGVLGAGTHVLTTDFPEVKIVDGRIPSLFVNGVTFDGSQYAGAAAGLAPLHSLEITIGHT